MSDIIHLLPDSVANQIAAGEVIQRPSSVIKELVENSIDAGATMIQVYVVDAGKSCVQVIDNGQGMSETDARLSFERHATSKISAATDLFSLRTMGFRGEALASIAAVAQVELKTRTKSEDVGVSICIEGSKLVSQELVSCPVGANFAVKNLFFNIPARRKFLKTNQTELSNIMNEFERIALAHPDISFTLHSNDTLVMNLAAGNFRQRILGIFGRKLDQQLVPVQVETSLVSISGFVGLPSAARKKGAHQYFFVNGRYMRHPYFSKAVMTAYERLLPEGEQVPYFLHLQVDPSRIDVNIHPTKTEIKFQDEQPVWQIILAAVREALGRSGAVPTIDFDTAGRPDIPVFTTHGEVVPPEVEVDTSYNPFEQPGTNSASSFATPARSEGRGAMPRAKSKVAGWEQLNTPAECPSVQSLPEEPAAPESPTLYGNLSKDEQQLWERSGAEFFQYKGRFVVTSVKSGLLFVEQRRAHIRILYEQYLLRLREKKGPSQGLLFPQLIQLPPSQAALLEELTDELTSVGFDISNLGGGSFSVLAIPAGTEGLDPGALVGGLLDDAVSKATGAKAEIGHIIASSLAKKAALPVGQALSQEEMEDLIEKLFACETPNYTPDGKLILSIFSQEQIEKIFA